MKEIKIDERNQQILLQLRFQMQLILETILRQNNVDLANELWIPATDFSALIKEDKNDKK